MALSRELGSLNASLSSSRIPSFEAHCIGEVQSHSDKVCACGNVDADATRQELQAKVAADHAERHREESMDGKGEIPMSDLFSVWTKMHEVTGVFVSVEKGVYVAATDLLMRLRTRDGKGKEHGWLYGRS